MADLSRLSPYNIQDDLVRGELYREIRTGSNDWTQYEIKPDEIFRPELAAYRFYGTDELKWVVLVAAKLDDLREPLESGTVLLLPSSAWIRERIKYYQDIEARNA
jgi:hypothetical protein